MSPLGRPLLFWLLAALLAAELAAAVAVTGVLLVDLAVAQPASWAAALALTVLVLLTVVWMAATLLGLFRGQAWVRASAIVWQVLQFAIGLGALQGDEAQPTWGWPLIAVAALAFVVLFAPPVVRVTSRREQRD